MYTSSLCTCARLFTPGIYSHINVTNIPMERSQDRVKTGRSGSALDNLGSPTFFLPFPHVEPLSYYDRDVNAVLPPSLGSLASASCPPRCRDVGIRLFDGSRRHLWDRIVARDDPVNIFDLTSPTGPDPARQRWRVRRRSQVTAYLHTFRYPRLTYFNDVDILVAFLKFLRLIKASMPLGSASPTTSLSTGSPYFSLCFSISSTPSSRRVHVDKVFVDDALTLFALRWTETSTSHRVTESSGDSTRLGTSEFGLA
ncbi:hypothetical protein BDZ89DRAFT_1053316 [Hymenopellis radicata]|nr:hypothetical protein BDZ89DRAFT_1053316 [Hymenopellis radicata]